MSSLIDDAALPLGLLFGEHFFFIYTSSIFFLVNTMSCGLLFINSFLFAL